MKRLWLILLLTSAFRAQLPAQQPIITPDTPVNTQGLLQWLHSGDPRLIAWAADFARRNHDAETIGAMPALLEHWPLPQGYPADPAQREQFRAATAVLDTLIQEDVPVPASTISAIAGTFPAQAAILITRVPAPAAYLTLHDWTYGGTGSSWGARLLARFGTMMLAGKPDSELVAQVLAASEEELNIYIVPANSGTGYGFGSGSFCGDSIGGKVAQGWPQVYTYDLVENDSQTNGGQLLDLGGDRIAYRRFPENTPWGSCNGVGYLNALTRHRLLAYWLGVDEKAMDWQPVESVSIVWVSRADYERRLGAAVEAHQEKLQATVEALRQKGLLTSNDAQQILIGGAIAYTLPRLKVAIQCQIKPCPLNQSIDSGK